MSDFKLYNIIIEEIEKRKKENNYVLEPLNVYNKYKNPVSKEHSQVLIYIILHYFKLNNDTSDIDKLSSIKVKDKKIAGKFEGEIYNNKRVRSGITLGECHSMNDFPKPLLEILDIYFDLYKTIREK